MSDINDLLASIPVDQIASQFGVSDADAKKAVDGAVRLLTGSLEQNASQASGAQALASALASKDLGFLDSLSLDQIDLADGQKILGHIFGDQNDAVAQQLSGGGTQGLIQKVLPIIAPIVLAWLAKNTAQKDGGKVTADSGNVVQDILGSLTGGQKGSAGGVADLLTSVLKGL
ncbi:MAG: DUF937 domain-containing protein [Aeromicrobium sp.]|uniref:DUF937 domain-containing protein n=1 Tax=Aeromicrobium sp. TaxID=1871063 RepID=UPI0039E68130